MFSSSTEASTFDTETSLAFLPPLLHDIHFARYQYKTHSLNPSALLALAKRVLSFREYVLKAGANLEMDSNDPTVIREIPNPDTSCAAAPRSVYTFSSLVKAGNYTLYWAYRIIANRLLLSLYDLRSISSHCTQSLEEISVPEFDSYFPCFRSPTLLEEEAVKLGANICASIPYTRSYAPFG